MKICYVKHYMRVRSLGVVYLGGSGSGSLMESYSSSCPGQHSSEGITTICGKFLKRGITDHLTSAWKTCMQVKKQQLEPDIEQQTSSKLGKESVKTILSPCLFNFYSEYIMQNARLDESQAGIKISRRNINNLRYADDTTLMAESKEELKSLLIRVKEGSKKTDLKLNIQKTKIMESNPITSWQIDGGKKETMRLYFLGLQNHCRGQLQPWN